VIAATPGGAAASDVFPKDAATDLLLRRAPRTRSRLRTAAPTMSRHRPEPLDLDHSYLAVQGPPGTGKTYVGSHVIARLVAEKGYRVGVVAQSHAVVENMLERVVAAGRAGYAGREGAQGEFGGDDRRSRRSRRTATGLSPPSIRRAS
jgi:uncharacterized protein